MFIHFVNSEFTLITNASNLISDLGGTIELRLISNYTNTIYPPGALNGILGTVLDTNDRYSMIILDVEPFWYNSSQALGVYTYSLIGAEGVIDEGLATISNESQAYTPPKFVSNNENMESIVYFE
jgi:hypothetical protein